MTDDGYALEVGYFPIPDANDSEGVIGTARLAGRLGYDLLAVQDHPYQPAQLDTLSQLDAISRTLGRTGIGGGDVPSTTSHRTDCDRGRRGRPRPRRRTGVLPGRAHDRALGARSGIPRRIEIWFHRVDGRWYLTGMPFPRSWYANVRAHTRFIVHLKHGVTADLPATAVPVDEATRRRVITAVLDLIDARHFVWEGAADEYAALVTSWWRGGYVRTGPAAARWPIHKGANHGPSHHPRPRPNRPPARIREVQMNTPEANQNPPASTTDVGGQLTAENLSVEVDGETLVFRRFGNSETDAPPLLCLQHFRGNLDNWDPALVDRLARDREVILLANRGVGSSTGIVPDNVTDMTRDVLRFVDALGLEHVDLLGFSLGGYIAQELALVRPRLVRRIVLAGTAPQGAPHIHRWSDDVYALATRDVPDADHFVKLFFSGSEESRAKGMEFLGRTQSRQIDHDEATDLATRDAQLAAITRWGIPDPSKLARLGAITQPAFVANGDNDTMMITENSYLLAHHLPNAQLRIYPDSGHGFLDQYPELFADHVNAFLNGG
jgi:pimeloyl-ACP methyl ester carboxylesterase